MAQYVDQTYDNPIRAPKAKQEEIKLTTTSKERQRYETMADLYSIIVATEHLERAFVRDVVDDKEYEKHCSKLIAQFRTLRDTLQETVPSIEQFMAQYKISCKAAHNRLIVKGVPATVEHGQASDNDDNTQLSVFHAVQTFITTMDSLKLDMRAVDELHPHLSELADSLNKVNGLPPDNDCKTKVKQWLIKLNAMRASDELDDEQARQMSFDLETAYNAFHKFLGERNKK